MPSHRSRNRWLAGTITACTVAAALMLASWMPTGSGKTPVLAQPAPAAPPSWPMFGGSPARNMVNTTAKNLPVNWVNAQGVINPANVLWSAELGSRAYGGPTIAGGKVFVGTNNQAPRNPKLVNAQGRPVDLGVLMVFDQANGKFLYQTVFPKLQAGRVMDWPLEGLCSAPTAEGDRIYFTSNRCEVVCADMKTGNIVWKVDMIKELGVFPHNMTAGSPLIIGDDLYVVTANGVDGGHLNLPAPKAPSFLKLDKRNGKVLWQDNSPTNSLVLALKNGQFDRDLFKDLVNRAELVQHGQWSHPAYAVVGGQPQIVFPGGDGWLRSFTPQGNLLWKFDCNPKDSKYELGGKGSRSDFIAAPVIYKDRLYIGLGQEPEHLYGVGHLWCIDMTKRGDVSPELVVNGAVWPPVTRPNPNSAAVWHYGGAVVGKNGKKDWQFGRTMSTCAIHDDLVYATEMGGVLHCLDANTGKLYWQHDMKSETWTSPYWADGRVHLGNDNGDVLVFAHGKEKKILAVNDMAQPVRTGPIAVGNVLYVVAGNKLYALKK